MKHHPLILLLQVALLLKMILNYLKEMDLYGAIMGKALYEGTVTLDELMGGNVNGE